jgi:hypothetical protein
MDVEIVGKFLSTLPEDDDHPYRTGPWRPQTTEWDADGLTVVEGEIPHDLDGVYLRNTENPLHPALKFYHPFDGDGMVHVVGFRDGKAFYRNRFIRTDGFAAENEAGGPLWPGLAEPVQIAKREKGWGARTLMKDASSTDVIVHRGTALTSFYQCGDLYRVDPYSGDTLGKADWGGAFPFDWGVSAHPKVDDIGSRVLNSANRVAPSRACWTTRSVHSSPSSPSIRPTALVSPNANSVGLELDCSTYSPIARAAVSASCQRRSCEPGAHVEWVPLEIRSGRASLHIGPSATLAASNTRQCEASSFMSVVSVTRYPSSSPVLPTRGAIAVSLP